MTEKTVKCPICKRMYKMFLLFEGDQTSCPRCREEISGNTYEYNC